MKELNETEISVLKAMAEQYFEVLPPSLRTYCSLTASISRNVLLHHGIESELLPCQVWCATPSNNFVIGFLGQSSKPNKWDGHVVCSAGNFLIDAALHHFNVEFGVNVPTVAVIQRFSARTNVISRLDLDDDNRLWWHSPPHGTDMTVPPNPPELVTQYSEQLIDRLKSMRCACAFT